MPIQQPAQQIGPDSFDAVIGGAGPAGCAAAILLAGQGKRVLLLEKEPLPRDKVCGDLLVADSLNCLKEIGLYESVVRESRRSTKFTASSPSRIRVTVEGEFLTLRRRTLDALLAEEAQRQGAVLALGKVESISARAGEGVTVHVRGRERPFTGKVGLAALGAHVAPLSGTGMITRKFPSALALRSYVSAPVEMDHLLAVFDKSIIPGYAWIFPLKDHVFNIGVGVFLENGVSPVNLKKLYETFVRSFPLAHEILSKAYEQTPLVGAPLRCGLTGSRFVDNERLLAIGECAGTTYPLTGEGIGKAMETGILAARLCIEALDHENFSRLNDYGPLLQKTLKSRYDGYQLAQKWASKAWVGDFLAGRARKSPGLQSALAGIFNETMNPKDIFSLKGLLKAVLH